MTLNFIQSILNHDWYTLSVKLGYQALAWVFVLFACFIDLKTGITASRANGVFKTSSYGLRMTLKKFKMKSMTMTIRRLFLTVLATWLLNCAIWWLA